MRARLRYPSMMGILVPSALEYSARKGDEYYYPSSISPHIQFPSNPAWNHFRRRFAQIKLKKIYTSRFHKRKGQCRVHELQTGFTIPKKMQTKQNP